ncbi:MAG: NYN domain-containing protein [Methanoregulaceae archaeon]|nr:NYN domain-containing protein [Methanoregulaceae archaeon]
MPIQSENTIHAQQKLAVLIDADNAQSGIIEGLVEEIAKYGVASVKRIYGNWTSPSLQPWKETLLKYSIQPVQQFSYTKGKNTTDSALIIDAMDLLYTGNFDGFCLVSSDSDFTRLASRLRESGKMVYGFGEEKTPDSFVKACDKFIFTEILRKSKPFDGKPEETPKGTRVMKPFKLKEDTKLVTLLKSAVEDCSDDDGWANLSDVGNIITKKSPEFDSRNWGYKKLKDLVKEIELFDIEERQIGNAPGNVIYLKVKKAERKTGKVLYR